MGYDKKIRRVDLDMYDADALLKVMKDKKIDTKDIIKTTGLSLRTIDRYLAPNNKDIVKESTLRLIILACGENYETFVNEEIKKNKQSLGNKEVTDETEEETSDIIPNIQIDFAPLLDRIDTLIHTNHKDVEELTAQINKLAIDIHTLGNIQMQTMEYIRDIMKSQDEIKGIARQFKNRR